MLSKLWALFFGEELNNYSELYGEKVKQLQNAIRLHGYSTKELILEYFKERFEKQSELGKVGSYGNLTILTDYCEETEVLRLKILNATLSKSGLLDFQVHNPIFFPCPNWFINSSVSDCAMHFRKSKFLREISIILKIWRNSLKKTHDSSEASNQLSIVRRNF
jgi:hypothetical protein